MTDLARTLGQVAVRHRLAEIYAFGSRASEMAAKVRGAETTTVHPGSDLDVGVEPERGIRLTLDDKVALASAFEDLFGVRRVDLVVCSEAPAFLALDIISGELLYCSDPDDQANHELYVMRRAGDLAPFERERRRMIMEEGAR